MIELLEHEKSELINIAELLLSKNKDCIKLGLSLFLGYENKLKDYRIYDYNGAIGFGFPYTMLGTYRLFYIKLIYDDLKCKIDYLYNCLYLTNLVSIIYFIISTPENCYKNDN